MASVIRGNDNFDSAGGAAMKAWVNFNGTGTVAIRAQYNVSSITDGGTGIYTVNFTNAMPDTNYATNATGLTQSDGASAGWRGVTLTTTAIQIATASYGGYQDASVVSVAVFR